MMSIGCFELADQLQRPEQIREMRGYLEFLLEAILVQPVVAYPTPKKSMRRQISNPSIYLVVNIGDLTLWGPSNNLSGSCSLLPR